MTDQEKQLLIENTAAVRGLNAKLEEFEKHVMDRVGNLEKKEAERGRDMKSTLSLLVATAALAVSVIINFFRHGGK